MANYYNGNSEIQGGDGLQTLVLMNPGYVSYSDGQQPQQQQASQSGNFMFLNNHQHQSLSHAPPPTTTSHTQQFVGIPLSTQPQVHDISGLHAFMPRVQYNMYNPVELATSQHDVARFQQGLSLTLSSHQSGFTSQAIGVSTISPTTGDETRNPGGGSTPSASGVSNGVSGMHSVLLNSKYLNATHELLEEVVNVSKSVFNNSDQSSKNMKMIGGGDGSPPQTITGEETSTKRVDGPDLTTAERQEIQMKKAKLINMLDEVEQRYRQYHNQMQLVISWFEQAAGIGSAKTYTALALQTISKQFRCLKDAIMGQIKNASRSLGEDDNTGINGKTEGGSRLKFVDNQLRQQRALQQIGMIQHNAWRPQRGLPERSVSVLRAWLFEHFLHPYPKDSDKHMLAKQTGLTRSQVSNWFINARVRLWKPMVEEMYLEEIKEQEQNKSEENKASKSEQSDDNENNPSSSKQGKSVSPENSKQQFNFNQPPPPQIATVSTSPTTTRLNFQNPSGFTLINSDQIPQFSPKKPRNNDFMANVTNPTDFMGGLGGYPIGEIGRFTTEQFQPPYSGNAVSLTLGLPHCDNLSISGAQQSFIHNQNIQETNEFEAMNQASSSHSTAMYETMNIPNQKRFAAQPLPDFVA
ncbi:hypothetical protein QVD17_37546 [Tagetes erecta]|uniref:Homeobox domain-containing protein n=1 Tax=Tagetes erecta TaxID=13708 RepID=A0AAD8NK46_TARER|nr:hypothetical protein QVD17_37546 [Tagetes erecta]